MEPLGALPLAFVSDQAGSTTRVRQEPTRLTEGAGQVSSLVRVVGDQAALVGVARELSHEGDGLVALGAVALRLRELARVEVRELDPSLSADAVYDLAAHRVGEVTALEQVAELWRRDPALVRTQVVTDPPGGERVAARGEGPFNELDGTGESERCAVRREGHGLE